MGYLFLAFANIAGTVKGYCGKIVSNSVKKPSDAMLANFLRMILCSIIGFAVVMFAGGFSEFSMNGEEIFISLLSGLSNAIFVISWLFAIHHGAYMLVDVFLTVGLLVPIALCSVFFDEKIELNHIAGFTVLVFAVWIMCSYSSTVKSKMTLKSILILLLCGLSQGVLSFTQKWFVYSSENASIPAFNFYTYLFASIILFSSFMIFKKENNPKENSEKFKIKPISVYITVMAIMLFLSSFLMTLAATKLDAALLYPLSTGLSLILSSVMCSVFFKEKLNSKCIIGIILSFCSIILINLF